METDYQQPQISLDEILQYQQPQNNIYAMPNYYQEPQMSYVPSPSIENPFEIGAEEEEEEEEKNEEKSDNTKVKKNCSLDEHKEIEAIFYCQECKVNMCRQCEKAHSKLLKNHHIYSLDKDINEIFTGLCTKPNHSLELQFFCLTHNELCCAACISKVRLKGNGQHKNCQIYYITKIKKLKMQNLEKNIKDLEELSGKLEPSIKELKSIYEKINESKDRLKLEIQKLFTKIRTELNKREDELYLAIDKKYDELFFKEQLIKESEKLPNIVKTSLEKGKIKENDWNDENKLNKIINDCIKIENTIKNLNLIYDKINVFNSNKDLEIEFNPKNSEIEEGLLNEIKEFGIIKVKDKDIKKEEKTIEDRIEEEEEEEDEDPKRYKKGKKEKKAKKNSDSD